MVALPQTVNVEEQAGQGGSNVLIPEGQYQAVAVKSEQAKTQKGGSMVVITFVITHGQHQNTEFLVRLNIVNTNQKAVEIAYKEIANIGKAIGLTHVSNTDQLHNKPLIIEVKNKKQNDWTNDKGEVIEGKEASEIKKYHSLPKGGVSQSNEFKPPEKEDQVENTEASSGITEADAPAKNPFA